MDFNTDFSKLQTLERDQYLKVYQKLGSKMFSECIVPTVADFCKIVEGQKDEKTDNITKFTGNGKDINNSVNRRDATFSEEESSKFINSVIAANVTDITESGFFYKKLISSCDNMRITEEDCHSEGQLYTLPINEATYNYKIKFHYINELKKATETYEEFVSLTEGYTELHIRNFLTCNVDINHRHFCKTCAGIYKRSKHKYFVPKNIGVYITYQITEQATQASLDSMNKGTSEKVNKILECRLVKKDFPSYKEVKERIEQIIDTIGDIGVMSRYYEVALLSRFYRNSKDGSFTPSSLGSSFCQQGDKLGQFIYKPRESNFIKLLSSRKVEAESLKSQIMMDTYR